MAFSRSQAIASFGFNGGTNSHSAVSTTTITTTGLTASTLVGDILTIVSGTGAGSFGTITANTATTITVSSWSGTQPAGAGTYRVSPVVAYSSSFAAGTAIVIGYVNNTLSTANITSVSDSVGNTFVQATYPGVSATNGSVSLLYSILDFPVTASDTITFTPSGVQLCVFSGSAFTNMRFADPSTSGTQGQTTNVAAGSAWTIPITPNTGSGLAVAAFGFYKDYTFGTAPSAGASGSTFASWYDGGLTYKCSLGLTYEAISTTGANTLGLTSTSSGVTYVGVSIHLREYPVLPSQRVVMMM